MRILDASMVWPIQAPNSCRLFPELCSLSSHSMLSNGQRTLTSPLYGSETDKTRSHPPVDYKQIQDRAREWVQYQLITRHSGDLYSRRDKGSVTADTGDCRRLGLSSVTAPTLPLPCSQPLGVSPSACMLTESRFIPIKHLISKLQLFPLPAKKQRRYLAVTGTDALASSVPSQ